MDDYGWFLLRRLKEKATTFCVYAYYFVGQDKTAFLRVPGTACFGEKDVAKSAVGIEK